MLSAASSDHKIEKIETPAAPNSQSAAEKLPIKQSPPQPSHTYQPTTSLFNQKPLFNLSGITVSGGQPLALVNNQVVAVGDVLKEGATVKDIQPGKVILVYKNRDVLLTIN